MKKNNLTVNFCIFLHVDRVYKSLFRIERIFDNIATLTLRSIWGTVRIPPPCSFLPINQKNLKVSKKIDTVFVFKSPFRTEIIVDLPFTKKNLEATHT